MSETHGSDVLYPPCILNLRLVRPEDRDVVNPPAEDDAVRGQTLWGIRYERHGDNVTLICNGRSDGSQRGGQWCSGGEVTVSVSEIRQRSLPQAAEVMGSICTAHECFEDGEVFRRVPNPKLVPPTDAEP